jgi:hypothetical protein
MVPGESFNTSRGSTDSRRIVGHAHVVIQEMTSTSSTQVLNPLQFAFFKGLNFQDVNGVSSLAVDGGLPRGAYRICTIMCKFVPLLITPGAEG